MEERYITDIESLIISFNLARRNNLDVGKIARQIALLAVDQLNGFWIGEIKNEHLKKDLIEYIEKTLEETNEIKPIYDENNVNYEPYGITDEKGNIIYKINYVYFAPNGHFNEFFRAHAEKEHGCRFSTVGMVTQNGLAFVNKFYALDSDKDFLTSISQIKENNIKKFFLNNEYYICREYDEKGIAAISYVYPRHKENYFYEIGEKVGEIVKYTKTNKELYIYERKKLNEEEGKKFGCYCPNANVVGDVANLVTSEPNSGRNWKQLEESTRIYKSPKKTSNLIKRISKYHQKKSL